MSQDGMPMPAASHPVWCDPSEHDGSCGHHQSASYVVPADPASDTVVELHLTSTFHGLKPSAVLMLELTLAGDDRPVRYPLTLTQAGRLHEAVGHLLVAGQPVTTRSGAVDVDDIVDAVRAGRDR